MVIYLKEIGSIIIFKAGVVLIIKLVIILSENTVKALEKDMELISL